MLPSPLALCLACTLSLPLASCAPVALTADPGNIEGTWLFCTDPPESGEADGWQSPEFDDSAWRTIEVPGSWEPQGVTDPRPGEAARPKNGMPWSDYDGVAWYRLHVTLPADWAGRNLALELGSVDDQDRTYFNGRLISETGPGLERSVLVWRRYNVPASLLKTGEENVIAIRVFDGGGPGGIDGPMLSLLPQDLAATPLTVPQADRPLDQRFATPAGDSRILRIVHGWPDEPASQDSLIRSLISQGFGGVVCNVSFSDYLKSEAKWQAFERAVNQARAAGMTMWLYDERGYPSGLAGGQTMQGHPEWEALGLLVAETDSDGGPVALQVPPGMLVSAAAYAVTDAGLDLTSALDLAADVRDGALTRDLPAGRWHVVMMTEGNLYEGTHAANSLGDKLPYINLLMPEPTARFIQLTHQAYADRLGPDLGEFFPATFTDEPSLMSYYMRPMSYRPLPWSPAFAATFRERRGYDIMPLLPCLVADAGPRTPKVRHDFWLTVGELVADGFFGQIQTWCREHNIASGGHALLEENIVDHVPLYGDFFRCVRRTDAPSIDCLTSIPSQVPWYAARLISSIAELEGRPLTMCETSDFGQVYRPTGDERPIKNVTVDEIRGTCNRLLLNGINTVTSYYTFAGLKARQLRDLNLEVGRANTLLRGGRQVADVALVYPIESLWAVFTPARQGATESPRARLVNHFWRQTQDQLYASRRDFTNVDSRALTEAKLEGDTLVHGDLRWRAVVLPATTTLPLTAWQNLATFWRGGGIVVAVSDLPTNSESEFPSPAVQAIAAELFGAAKGPAIHTNAAGGVGISLPRGFETLLPKALDAVLDHDVAIKDPAAPLRVTHREVEGQQVYFVINDSGEAWEGDATFAAAGEGEQWDPVTGDRSPAGTTAHLNLKPYCGTLLRYPVATLPARKPVADGQLAGVRMKPLPAVKPGFGKGEFVDAQLTQDGPGWRATAALTKSRADTFMFLTYNFAQPQDWRGAAGLSLDSLVPEGQKMPGSLLVILHDADGGQYLGDTGRTLSLGGSQPWFIAFSQFSRAGWVESADTNLDLDKITAMSIGWGGYFGTEGEKVQFTLMPPELVME